MRAPFRAVKCRHGSIISCTATAKRASGYTQSSSKTAADVLVSMALIASICIGEIFAAGEGPFIMQLGALLQKQQPLTMSGMDTELQHLLPNLYIYINVETEIDRGFVLSRPEVGK